MPNNKSRWRITIRGAVAKQLGTPQIVLTGGCFQNKYLTEKAVQHLQKTTFALIGINVFRQMMVGLLWGRLWQHYEEFKIRSKNKSL